jgi:hypothetical protein
MTPTTPQQATTIDIEEPAREIELAAEMFVRGEHGMDARRLSRASEWRSS